MTNTNTSKIHTPQTHFKIYYRSGSSLVFIQVMSITYTSCAFYKLLWCGVVLCGGGLKRKSLISHTQVNQVYTLHTHTHSHTSCIPKWKCKKREFLIRFSIGEYTKRHFALYSDSILLLGKAEPLKPPLWRTFYRFWLCFQCRSTPSNGECIWTMTWWVDGILFARSCLVSGLIGCRQLNDQKHY